MGKRLLSTCLLWGLIISLIRFADPVAGVWLVTAVAVLTLRELYALIRRMGIEPFDRLGLTFAAALMLAPLLPRTPRCRYPRRRRPCGHRLCRPHPW